MHRRFRRHIVGAGTDPGTELLGLERHRQLHVEHLRPGEQRPTPTTVTVDGVGTVSGAPAPGAAATSAMSAHDDRDALRRRARASASVSKQCDDGCAAASSGRHEAQSRGRVELHPSATCYWFTVHITGFLPGRRPARPSARPAALACRRPRTRPSDPGQHQPAIDERALRQRFRPVVEAGWRRSSLQRAGAWQCRDAASRSGGPLTQHMAVAHQPLADADRRGGRRASARCGRGGAAPSRAAVPWAASTSSADAGGGPLKVSVISSASSDRGRSLPPRWRRGNRVLPMRMALGWAGLAAGWCPLSRRRPHHTEPVSASIWTDLPQPVSADGLRVPIHSEVTMTDLGVLVAAGWQDIFIKISEVLKMYFSTRNCSLRLPVPRLVSSRCYSASVYLTAVGRPWLHGLVRRAHPKGGPAMSDRSPHLSADRGGARRNFPRPAVQEFDRVVERAAIPAAASSAACSPSARVPP